jgi:hypothetical protein
VIVLFFELVISLRDIVSRAIRLRRRMRMLKDNIVIFFGKTIHRFDNLLHNWVPRAIFLLLGLKVVLLQPQAHRVYPR